MGNNLQYTKIETKHYLSVVIFIVALIPIIIVFLRLNALGLSTYEQHYNISKEEVLEIPLVKNDTHFIADFVIDSEKLSDLMGIYFYHSAKLNEKRVNHATLSTLDQSCFFQMQTSTLLSKDRVLMLERKHCEISKLKKNEIFRLNIEAELVDQFSLIASNLNQTKHFILFSNKKNMDTQPKISLVLSTKQPVKTKFELLTKMWDMEHSSMLIVVIIIGIVMYLYATILFIGIYIYKLKRSYLLAFSLSFFFLSISIFYASFTPPFHGADEPDHFLGFTKSTQSIGYQEKALEIANLGNFARIRQQSFEHFKIHDYYAPYSAGWGNRDRTIIEEVDMENRSPLTYVIWHFFNYAIGEIDHIGEKILILRLFNSFFVAVAFFLLLYNSLASTSSLILGGVAGMNILGAVSLPFFAMAISNYPIIVGVFLLILATAIWKPINNVKKILKSMLFGILSAFFISSGKISIASFPFIFLIFFMLRPKFKKNKLIFIDSFIIAASFGFTEIFLTYPRDIPFKHIFYTLYLDQVWDISPNPSVLLSSIVFIASMFMTSIFKIRVKSLSVNKLTLNLVFLATGFGIIFLPFFLGLTDLPDIERGARKFITQFEYLKKSVLLFVFGPSFYINDFYVQRSFWVGLGWLDVRIHDDLLRPIKLIPFLGVIFLFKNYCVNNLMGLLKILALFFVLIVCLVALAAGGYNSQINLHGRYLILIFISYLSIPLLLIEEGQNLRKIERYFFSFQSLFTLIAYTAVVLAVVKRYFG